MNIARVAQLVEHSTDTRGVPGSNPGARTEDNSHFITNNNVGSFEVFVFVVRCRLLVVG